MIVKARNNEDEIILVETQNTHELYYWECILYGASQTLAECIDWGENLLRYKESFEKAIQQGIFFYNYMRESCTK